MAETERSTTRLGEQEFPLAREGRTCGRRPRFTIRLRRSWFAAATLAILAGCLRGQSECPPSNLPEPTPGNTATIPVPRGPWTDTIADDWGKIHRSFVNRAAEGHIDLLFLGDSITHGWRYAGFLAWETHFGLLLAANFGLSGDQTQHLLWRIQNGELDGFTPRKVVVLIGTNNLYWNTPAEIAEGVAAVLREVRTRAPKSRILLMGVFPRGKAADDPNRAKIKAINAIISQYADCAISYLDIGDRFLNPDGSMRDDLMPDYLHPSGAGYTMWANAINSWVYTPNEELTEEAPGSEREP